MITRDEALRFAEDWVASWNSHDLDRILSHYSDDFEMSSPRITLVMNEPSGKLKGKDKVGAYWTKSLAQSPDLRFELREILISADSLVIYYHNVTRDKMAAEIFIFDSAGHVAKSMAHYS